MSDAVLEINNLTVRYPLRARELTAISDVSLSIAPGEILGVVGESGAGKSTVGTAVMRLLEAPGYIAGGQIISGNQDLCQLSDAEMRKVRGKRIGMVFQDPMTSLNPLFTVGDQLIETICEHLDVSKAEAHDRAVQLLEDVGMPAASARMSNYPHQFSGGMRQRVVIALALCAEPECVIADEPTTALDVSVQAQVISVLKRLCEQRGAAVLLITHDMGVIAETADRVVVMYGGRVVECGTVDQIVSAPHHPYTQGLISCIPDMEERVERLTEIPGTMPRLWQMPEGCPFNTRCTFKDSRCDREPPWINIDGSDVACWKYDEPGMRRENNA